MANARLELTAEAIQCDREFHKLLGKATQNKILTALTRSMTTSMLDDWISSLHTPGRIEKTVGEHGLILEAIKQGDAEAAMEHMANHLRNSRSRHQGRFTLTPSGTSRENHAAHHHLD